MPRLRLASLSHGLAALTELKWAQISCTRITDTYLCVTTPLAACWSVSCRTELKAPRNLNAPLHTT